MAQKTCTHPVGAHTSRHGTQLLDDLRDPHPVDASPRTVDVVVTECTLCGTVVSTRLA